MTMHRSPGVVPRHLPEDNMLGRFVTAKLKGKNDCRQGYIIQLEPLRIRGESGQEYDCEGDPVLVTSFLPGTKPRIQV
jgi:hypothetical protein